MIDGDVENGSLMSGQSVGLINDIKPVKEIIKDLIDDAEKELEKVKHLLS